MADEDDEVVIKDSELHKYLNTSNFSNLNPDINFLLDLVSPKVPNQENYDSTDHNQHNSSSITQLRIDNLDYRGHFIKLILKTGLLYPDHLCDIGNCLDIENVTYECLLDRKRTIIYSSLTLGTLYGITICSIPKQLKMVLQIGFCLLSGLTISQTIQFKARFNEQRIVESFTIVIEKLFLLSKKCLNYIKESEITIRNRIIKQHSFCAATSEVGWIDADVSKTVFESGLLLPELRKQFYKLLKVLSFDFSNTCKCMRNLLRFKPGVDNNSYYVNLQNFDLLKIESIIPSLGELKKVYNLYLLTQSEFLRRLLLSFVTELWEDCNSVNSLHSVMKSLVYCTQSVKLQTKHLELVFKNSLNFITQQGSPLPKRDLLKNKEINDRIYTFIGKFITKTDVQLLSLISDLRMIDDWLRNCEENNRTITESNDELLSVFHQRIVLLKGNIDTFNSTFNDSLSILRDLTNGSRGNIDTVVEKIKPNIENVNKTGVEVGKSDFNPNGEDEIFVSLSGPSSDKVNFTMDEGEMEVQKPLPKSVLLELKSALKGKRDEWIEREKKALGTSVNELDFDSLTNPDRPPSTNFELHKNTQRNNTSEIIDGIKQESETAINGGGVERIGNYTDRNKSVNDSESNSSLINTTFDFIPENFTESKSLPKSFIQQIKCAQEKFNLNAREEEYIEEVFD